MTPYTKLVLNLQMHDMFYRYCWYQHMLAARHFGQCMWMYLLEKSVLAVGGAVHSCELIQESRAWVKFFWLNRQLECLFFCSNSFCPTDSKFATCSDDGTVRIWDFMRCHEEKILRGMSAGKMRMPNCCIVFQPSSPGNTAAVPPVWVYMCLTKCNMIGVMDVLLLQLTWRP